MDGSLVDFAEIVARVLMPVGIYIFGIFAHELGHLVACVLVGWKPLVFSLGRWRSDGKQNPTIFRWGEFSVQVGIPTTGYARSVPRNRKTFRLKYFILVAAGPMVNIALAAGAFWYSQLEPDWFMRSAFAAQALHFFILYQLFIAGATLYPHPSRIGGSDGYKMWKLLWMNKEAAEQYYMTMRWSYLRVRAEEGRTAGFEEEIRTVLPASATDFAVRHMTASALMVYTKSDEGESRLRQLLPEAAPGEQRSKILDELACVPIYRDKPGMIDEGLGYIEEAIAEAPGRITLKATKAALLVRKGAYDEAAPIFEEVLAKGDTARDLVMAKCHMALASHRRGNTDEARKLLAEAEKIYPLYPLLPGLRKEIPR